MKNFTFRKELVEAQDELLRFAYKLTMDIDEANDLSLIHIRRSRRLVESRSGW